MLMNFAAYVFTVQIPVVIVVITTSTSVPVASGIVVSGVAIVIVFIRRIVASVTTCCRCRGLCCSCGWKLSTSGFFRCDVLKTATVVPGSALVENIKLAALGPSCYPFVIHDAILTRHVASLGFVGAQVVDFSRDLVLILLRMLDIKVMPHAKTVAQFMGEGLKISYVPHFKES